MSAGSFSSPKSSVCVYVVCVRAYVRVCVCDVCGWHTCVYVHTRVSLHLRACRVHVCAACTMTTYSTPEPRPSLRDFKIARYIIHATFIPAVSR